MCKNRVPETQCPVSPQIFNSKTSAEKDTEPNSSITFYNTQKKKLSKTSNKNQNSHQKS